MTSAVRSAPQQDHRTKETPASAVRAESELRERAGRKASLSNGRIIVIDPRSETIFGQVRQLIHDASAGQPKSAHRQSR
jgi:adenine-specific DNA methylase